MPQKELSRSSKNPLKHESIEVSKSYQNRTLMVIGLGYIGLPTAAVFATHGVNVIGLDVNQKIVDTINRGEIHIVEPGLDEVVKKAVQEGRLRATTTAAPADAFIVAVPTPFKAQHEPDLSYIEAVCIAIAPVLTRGNLILLESTSPVGTTERVAEWLAKLRPDLTFPQQVGPNSDIRVAHSPERIMPGRVLDEIVANDRVIGGMTRACSLQAIALYQTFLKGECLITNARTAEMCKLAENSFRDVNISFANELSIICKKLDINVWDLIDLANRHPRVNILQPGPGVGGHCIAVDPWFIVNKNPDEAKLIRTAREVNNRKPEWIAAQVCAAVEEIKFQFQESAQNKVRVALLGLTFKPDIDDVRESPAIEVANKLLESEGIEILLVEPNISAPPAILAGQKLVSLNYAMKNSEILVALVAHKEFKAIVRSGELSQKIVDAVGIFEKSRSVSQLEGQVENQSNPSTLLAAA